MPVRVRVLVLEKELKPHTEPDLDPESQPEILPLPVLAHVSVQLPVRAVGQVPVLCGHANLADSQVAWSPHCHIARPPVGTNTNTEVWHRHWHGHRHSYWHRYSMLQSCGPAKLPNRHIPCSGLWRVGKSCARVSPKYWLTNGQTIITFVVVFSRFHLAFCWKKCHKLFRVLRILGVSSFDSRIYRCHGGKTAFKV